MSESTCWVAAILSVDLRRFARHAGALIPNFIAPGLARASVAKSAKSVDELKEACIAVRETIFKTSDYSDSVPDDFVYRLSMHFANKGKAR